MRLSPKRRQTAKKTPEKRGRLRDNRSPTEPSGSSPGRRNATTSRKWPKTRGMMSIGPEQFECAKQFVGLLRWR